MSMKDNIIPHIRDCKMSAEIWTTIKNMYQAENTSRIMALKSKLFSMRMDESDTIAAFVARIKDVKDGLGDIKEVVSDSDLVSITLNGMRDEFQMFITGLAAMEKAPTFEDLTRILLQEEERRQNLNPQSDDLALMAKRRSFRGKQPKQQSQQKGGTSQKNPHKDHHNTFAVESEVVSDDGTKDVDATMYRQLVGSLIYLTTTKPDLAYSISVLSQFMPKPLESHSVAAKSVLRYLCGTVNYGILYADASDVILAGFLDSDWAGNLDDRRSITGYEFSIGSGVIAWSSKTQSTVALSFCEAEYQALCAVTCEAIWLRRLLNDTGKEQKNSPSIKNDNQSTIKLAYNPTFHKNTKHIDTQFHFIREKL
eukprot:PITA_24107